MYPRRVVELVVLGPTTQQRASTRSKMRSSGVWIVARSLVVLGAVLLSFAASTTRCSAENQKDVWVVKEINQFLGTTNIYLSPDGARCVVRDGELSILCAAPKWNVVLFRKSDNSGVDIPYEHFCRHGLNLMNPKQSLRTGIAKSISDEQLNVPCKEMKIRCGKQFFGTNDPVLFQATKKLGLREIYYKCTESVPVSPKVQAFLNGLFNVPREFTGVPLELSYYCTDGSVERTYSTLSVKKSRVPQNFFAYATGFKTAAIADLMISNKQKHQFESLLESVVEEEGAMTAAENKKQGEKDAKLLKKIPQSLRIREFLDPPRK